MTIRTFLSLFRLAIIAPALLWLTACSDDETNIIIGGGGGGEVRPSTVPSARMEVPKMKEGNQFIAHWSLERGDSVMTYCLEYSPQDYHSRWVAFRFDGRTRAKEVSRKDYSIRPQYPRDPYLSGSAYALNDDVSFNGYQHGHLCASADRLYSRTANDNTFYMTNMSPQRGSFNAPYWSEYEKLVQDLGRNKNFSDTLYVVKGGTITEGMTLGRVAGGRIVVPKYYFIALLKVKGGNYSGIAFWVEHKDYGTAAPSRAVLAGSAVNINRLEALTGIDFFPNLDDRIEEQVEDLCTPSAWGL